MKKKWTKSSGFTLAELLIVVAIIAVLVAISIPIFTSQLEKAREATDLSDVRSAYAEVMMAAISDDTTATYSKDSSQTIHKSNGLYSVTVSPLHQEQDNWQGNMDLNVGGVSSKDTTHWIGTPTASGSCNVSYNPQGDSVVLNWSGKSTGGGNTGGSGTITPGGSTTGGGSTPAPNPGTGGGTTGGTTGGGSTPVPNPETGGGTSGGTAGGNNNQGNSGTGDNTSSGNNNQGNTGGNTGGSTGGNTSGSDQGNNNSGDTGNTEDSTRNDLLNGNYEQFPSDINYTFTVGNIYSYNGILYLCIYGDTYKCSDPGQAAYWFRPITPKTNIYTSKDIETINGKTQIKAFLNDVYTDGTNFYLMTYNNGYQDLPDDSNTRIQGRSDRLWVKINLNPTTDFSQDEISS